MTQRHHVARIQLRWADLDAQGHVNNALVVDLLQEARASMLRSGGNADLLAGGVVVTAQQVEYLRPIQYSLEPLEIAVGVSDVGASRFKVAYHLRQGDELCVRAVTTLCPFDFGQTTPRRLTEHERGCLGDEGAPEVEMRPMPLTRLHGQGHAYDLTVRWSDQDAYGHVNNVKYFDYIQEARVAMTTQADPAMMRDGNEFLWVIARQDVDYLVQMSARAEPFVLHTAPVAIGRTSLTFACEITDPAREGLVLARARTVLVCAGLDGRSRPLPDSTRTAMEAMLVQS